MVFVAYVMYIVCHWITGIFLYSKAKGITVYDERKQVNPLDASMNWPIDVSESRRYF